MPRVQLTADAREDLRDLDGSARKAVLKAIRKLESEPEKRGQPLGSRQSSDLTTFRKLVVGDRDYRVIYRIEHDGTIVVVWVVGRRADNECYELALSRLRLLADPRLAGAAEQFLRESWSSAEQ